MARRLPRTFYARGAEHVAPELLGSVLCHRVDGAVRRARIVETEAYVGSHDLACHAARGRTRRTEVMFGPPGHAYVYLIYGMHDMLNVVTAAPDDPQAVLVRAAEPLGGLPGPANGPGRLCRSLGITVAGHNGADLCGDEDAAGDALWFEAGSPPRQVVRTTRIGVGYAGPWADAPLRFYDAASPAVSVRVRAAPRPEEKGRTDGTGRSGPGGVARTKAGPGGAGRAAGPSPPVP